MKTQKAVVVALGLLTLPALAMQGSANAEEGYSFGPGETLKVNGKSAPQSAALDEASGGTSSTPSTGKATAQHSSSSKTGKVKSKKSKKARTPKAKKPKAPKAPKVAKPKTSSSRSSTHGKKVGDAHPGVSRLTSPRAA